MSGQEHSAETVRPVFIDNRDGNTLALAIRSHLAALRREGRIPADLCVASCYPKRMLAAMFHGIWRIVETALWDVDALDLIEAAHLRFDARGLGELQLIAIGAGIDYRVSERDGRPFVEFSWVGYDDADPASGRGWARLEPDGALKGRLFIHQGDESAFTAYREVEARKPIGARGGRPPSPDARSARTPPLRRIVR